MAFVYILRCRDNTFYTGSARNLEKRIKTHQQKKGAKYTKGRLPVTIVYREEYSTFKQALKRERQIKKMTRTQKMKLIKAIKLL